jgi:peptidoglycan/LPS O-acetylase OafA/YrhL
MLRDQKLLLSLEGLRFISSVAIVMFHFVPYVANVAWIGKLTIAVDLFFVISGIVIAMHYDSRINTAYDYLEFVRRRIARIYPLHIATLAFYVAIGLLMMFEIVRVADPTKYNFSELIPNLLLVHAWSPRSEISFNYVSWSISAEFFVYLLFPAILWFVTRGVIAGLATTVAALAGGIFISHAVLDVNLIGLSWKLGIIRALPSFVFGVFLFRYRRELIRAMPARARQIGLHVLLAMLIVLVVIGANDYVLLACVYGVVACAFACDLSNQPTIPSWTPISSFGYLTYSIYMLHTVVATVLLTALLPRLLGTSTGMMLVAVIIAAFTTLGLAMLSYRYFEEPLRRRINSLTFPARTQDRTFSAYLGPRLRQMDARISDTGPDRTRGS